MQTTTDLPPQGRFASAIDIEAWIDRQQLLLAVIDHAFDAVKLGPPRVSVGPKFYHRDQSVPAHLRRGGVWMTPRNVGFRVDLFGVGTRIRAWGHSRTLIVDSHLVSPEALAHDLWATLVLAEVAQSPDLPYIKDGHGGIWQVHRLGCDMHVLRPGKVCCSCPT